MENKLETISCTGRQVNYIFIDLIFHYMYVSLLLKLSSDKWQLTFEQWPWKRLPHYAMGSGYLVAGSAINPLLAAAQVVPFHQFEDLYVTSLCAQIANVTFRTSSGDRYLICIL